MATQEQLEAALRNAAAKARQGDERAAMAARRFAAELKALRQGAPESAAPRNADDPSLWEGGRVPGTNPTEGLSTGQLFGAGGGKSVRDTALGIVQSIGEGGPAGSMVRKGFEAVDLAPPEHPFKTWADERLAANAEADAALMDTGAGMAGNVTGQVAQAVALPGPESKTRLARLLGSSLQGAIFAGAQPVAEGESRGLNALTGAALGAAGDRVAAGGSVLARRAADRLSPVVRQSIDLARSAGIPLNVAQTTNNPAIRAMQAATKYLPFSGAGKAADRQQEAFNRAVARSFGSDAPQLTDDVIRSARNRLSSVFNDIYGRNDVTLSPDAARSLLSIGREAASDMVDSEAKVVRNQLERIFAEIGEDGVMSGQKYQSLRTALQKVKAGQAGNNIGRFVGQLREVLDDAAAASVGPDDAAALAKVRGQWANLRTAEDALRQVSGATGNVRPASLWPLIRKGSTREMRELARIGQAVLKEGIGDSGTAQRQMWQGILTGGVGTGVGMAAGVPALAKLVAGGAIAGRALNSNIASKALQQGRPTAALARLLQPAPRLLPVGYGAVAPGIYVPPEDVEEEQP